MEKFKMKILYNIDTNQNLTHKISLAQVEVKFHNTKHFFKCMKMFI